MMLKSTNTGSNLKKKIVELGNFFVRGGVSNNVVDARNIHTKENVSDPFTKPLVRNYLCEFYHECLVNG